MHDILTVTKTANEITLKPIDKDNIYSHNITTRISQAYTVCDSGIYTMYDQGWAPIETATNILDHYDDKIHMSSPLANGIRHLIKPDDIEIDINKLNDIYGEVDIEKTYVDITKNMATTVKQMAQTRSIYKDLDANILSCIVPHEIQSLLSVTDEYYNIITERLQRELKNYVMIKTHRKILQAIADKTNIDDLIEPILSNYQQFRILVYLYSLNEVITQKYEQLFHLFIPLVPKILKDKYFNMSEMSHVLTMMLELVYESNRKDKSEIIEQILTTKNLDMWYHRFKKDLSKFNAETIYGLWHNSDIEIFVAHVPYLYNKLCDVYRSTLCLKTLKED